MQLNKALAIDGWMSERELTWLAGMAATRQVIVELGCYKGRSTRALADNMQAGGVVIAIDAWEPYREHLGAINGMQRGSREMNEARDAFYANLNDHIKAHRVVPLQLDHAKAHIVLNMIEPDFLFIDGNHDYFYVLDQLVGWLPKMKRMGLISGHDYHPGQFDGVVEAVGCLVPNHARVEGTDIWWAEIE